MGTDTLMERDAAPAIEPGLLADVVESAPVAILVCDERGRIALANGECERLFGYPRAELRGGSIDMLVPERVRRSHAGLREAYLESPQVRAMGSGRELYAQRRDGSLAPVEVALRPLRHRNRPWVLCMVADIGERKRLEDEVRRANEDLERRVRERTLELERADAGKQALLVELERQRAELERLSREDPLTRLANRRAFDLRLAHEIRRAERLGTPLAVAILDLDRFKRVNDRHGHALGDAVLREAGALLAAQCRDIDLLARYGGEEFTLALPGADLAAGRALCERIRAAFERHDWSPLAAGLTLTLSAGVASWRPGLGPAALLSEADLELYAAKGGGRNRVMPECQAPA